jgi:hypothetical protein
VRGYFGAREGLGNGRPEAEWDMVDASVKGNARMDLLARTHHRVDDLDDLRRMVQLAIQVEFTTVPTYLSALYSIRDKTADAYQALRSVVVEEMFHVNQVANLLVGIGGRPKMTDDAVPTYPSYLPSASHGTSRSRLPYIGLYCASVAIFRNVFMAIETPAPYKAPAEGQNYSTIGQFYSALEDGLVRCIEKYGASKVFKPVAGLRQRTDIYLGKFGGRALEVGDLPSARRAIRQIVQQGEGAVDPTRSLVSDQPWGTYNHYGTRLDGTYGPILGTPYELSHYFKFKRVVESGTFPDTYPVMSNPQISAFTNPEARDKARAFNKYYSVMLRSLEKAFEIGPSGRDIYFEITLPMMHSHMPQLANMLVTTTIASDGDSSVGPNAAATFEFEPGTRLRDAVGAVEALSGDHWRSPIQEMVASSRLGSGVSTRPATARSVGQSHAAISAHLREEIHKLQLTSEEAAFDL